MAEATQQELDLDQQFSFQLKLEKVKVGDKLKVVVNGVSDQAELFCTEKQNNPPKLTFSLCYYGVMTGKELVASKELNKWSFK